MIIHVIIIVIIVVAVSVRCSAVVLATVAVAGFNAVVCHVSVLHVHVHLILHVAGDKLNLINVASVIHGLIGFRENSIRSIYACVTECNFLCLIHCERTCRCEHRSPECQHHNYYQYHCHCLFHFFNLLYYFLAVWPVFLFACTL